MNTRAGRGEDMVRVGLIGLFVLACGLSPALAQSQPTPSAPPTPAGAGASEEALSYTETTTTYEVAGETPAKVRADMNVKRPLDRFGEHFDALTRWHVSWRLKTQRSDDGCRIAAAMVKVEVTYTFPKLVGDPPPVVRSLWDRYMAALITHESGHGETGKVVGREMADGLPALPAAANCEAMSDAAKTFVRAAIAKGGERDVAYDKETRHGLAQGAHFP